MVLHEDTEQALIKEALFETDIPMIVYSIDPFRILYVNKAFEEELGFYTDTIAEDPDQSTELVYTDERVAFIKKVIDNPLGSGKEPIEFKMTLPDTSQKWYSLQLFPLRVHNWMVGILSSTTERRPREAALQANHEMLEDYVRMMRHDLKGMMGNIQIVTNMIKEKIIAKEREELASYFELIMIACREVVSHAEELSERFFTSSENLDWRNRIAEAEEVNLAEEVFQAVDLYRAQLEYKNLGAKVVLSEGKMIVQADKMKCWQIIKNLVSNAIKFSHEDGQITIALKELKDVILLEVSDTGIGIPPAFRPFIFQKHSQAMRDGTKGEKPTGMGTYIVKQMVEAHGGEVWFESEEGRGSTFFVKLPK